MRARFWIFGLVACGVGCGPGRQAEGPSAKRSLSAPKVVQGAFDVGPLFGDVTRRANALGAGPLSIVASGAMNEGERMGAFVDVPQDACLLAYGRASASLEDIDLAAFADEGSPVAVDEGPDPRPTILVCPPHPDRVYLAVHAASGEGMCAIGAHLVPRARAAELAAALNARGTAISAARTPEAWPGLEDKVRNHRSSLGGKWEELRRVAISVDARAISAVPFPIEEGGCTDALVLPDDDVAAVEVDVLDNDGRLVARAKDGGPARSVTVCSPIAFAGSVQVRPHVGRGLVAVIVSKGGRDAMRDLGSRAETAWLAPTSPIEQTRAARNNELTKQGYGAASSTQNGQLQLGRRQTLPVDLSGACTRIDVVGGAPLALIDAALWADSGDLLAASDGTSAATLFACGKGKARLDLGTRGRPGPFSVLTRPEKWKDTAFGAHPLAASRMLARAAGGTSTLHEGTAGNIVHVAIDSARRATQDFTIAANKCLRVALGAQGEGTGVELRLFDVVSGEEIDRAHGQTSAAVRGCATGSPRSVAVEIRATGGKLDAIVGSRTTP